MNNKYNDLKKILADYGKIAVAFSGGVDSTLLLKVAHDVGKDKVIAINITSPMFPQSENVELKRFCDESGIKLVEINLDLLAEDKIRNNPEDRCYHCKKRIFSEIEKVAKQSGADVIVEGSNMDDLNDYRPGLKALRETDVKSPLQEAKLSKHEIREISKELELETWNKPSAACLASRIPYNEEITEEKLRMIEAGEDFLGELGFIQKRVRLNGDTARIEVEADDIERIVGTDMREIICRKFYEIGFSYVTVDMEGFRSGSLNKNLDVF